MKFDVEAFVDDLLVQGVEIPPFAPRAEVASWQKAFVDDWAWFDRRPVRSCRIRPALPFELKLFAEAIENPDAASFGHVIVVRVAAYLVRYAFKAYAAGERGFDYRAATDRDIEATLQAAGCDLEPMRRIRREASGPDGMAAVSEATHRDLLLAAVRCGEDRPLEARAAARRLRALMVADASDRWMMRACPAAEVFRRAAVIWEEDFTGMVVEPDEAEALVMNVVRPGGVLARVIGRRESV